MGHIINIRGTSGSGKTHLMRRIMARFKDLTPEYQTGRKRPLFYTNCLIAVLGSYESACGGCDTIKLATDALEAAAWHYSQGRHVLMEGLLMSHEVNHTLELHRKYPGALRVFILNTDIEKCLEQVNARRKARMGDKFTPVKEDHTRREKRTVDGSVTRRLKEAGVPLVVGSQESIYRQIVKLLQD
jgi:guanylate kinase